MGKHHTYRKRGSASSNPHARKPPPPARTYVQGGYLTSDTQCTNNPGGQLTLYYSVIDYPYAWVFAGTASWEAIKVWGPLTGPPEAWYRADDAGNGIDWTAVTTPGNVFHYVP